MATQRPFRDYYAVLGLAKSASDEEIRQAFRKLSRELHPDTTSGDADRFKEVNTAYEALGRGGLKPEDRAKYDRELQAQAPVSSRETSTQRPPGSPERTTTRGNAGDMFRDPEAFLKNMGFGTDDLLGAMGVSRNPNVRQQTRPREPEVFIPVNDLGLLNALGKAYKADEEGKWVVRRSPEDRRPGLYPAAYVVMRNENGQVSFYRGIKDWVDASIDISKREQTLFREQMRDDLAKQDTEIMGYTKDGRGFAPAEFWQPKGIAQYFNLLKRTAREKAEGWSNTQYQLQAEQISDLTLRNPKMYVREGVQSYNPYIVETSKRIPVSQLWDEVAKTEGLIVYEGVNRTPEGQAGRENKG